MSSLNEHLAKANQVPPPGICIDRLPAHLSGSRSRSTEIGPGADPDVWRSMAAQAVLAKLPESERRALLRWCRVKALKRHDVVWRQGDPSVVVALILEGYVKLSTRSAEDDATQFEVAGPGECIGDIVALLRRAHDANVMAASPCRLLLIDGRQFRQALVRQPEGLLALLHIVDENLRRTTEHLIDARTLTAPARLAKALLDLVRVPPFRAGGRSEFPFRLSQTELGAMTGVSREVVNKLLGQWRDEGWITMSGGSVITIEGPYILRVMEAEQAREIV